MDAAIVEGETGREHAREVGDEDLVRPAAAMIRAASCTVTPRTSSPTISTSPTCTPIRTPETVLVRDCA